MARKYPEPPELPILLEFLSREFKDKKWRVLDGITALPFLSTKYISSNGRVHVRAENGIINVGQTKLMKTRIQCEYIGWDYSFHLGDPQCFTDLRSIVSRLLS